MHSEPVTQCLLVQLTDRLHFNEMPTVSGIRIQPVPLSGGCSATALKNARLRGEIDQQCRVLPLPRQFLAPMTTRRPLDAVYKLEPRSEQSAD